MKIPSGARLRGNRRQEQGFALISVMAFLVLVLAFGTNMVEQAVQEVNGASRTKKETRAFHLAEAGVDYAAWQLYNHPSTSLPAAWSRSDLAGGTFTVVAEDYGGSDEAVIVTSTGNSQGWTSQVKVIGQFLGTTPSGQNPVFEHALFSDADLSLRGSFDVSGDAHCNGNADVRGNPTITGELTAGGSISIQGNPDIGGGATAGAPRIAMPTIDLEYYRSIADTVLEGGYTFSGQTHLDGVTFVEGDAHINGSFSGTGVIVVDGDAHINGNATVAEEDDEFAIVAAGNVRINGNWRIEGWVYAHNMDVPSTFEGNGNADIVGGVAADIVSCSGNMTVEYREATVELPGASTAPAQFQAISWRRVR